MVFTLKMGYAQNVYDFSQDDTQKFSSTLSDFNFILSNLLLNFLFKTRQKHKSAVERHALGTFLYSKLTSNFLIWHHSCSYHQGIICLSYHYYQLWLEKCSPLLCLLSTPWSILEVHNPHLRPTLQEASGHVSFQMMTVPVEAMSIVRIFLLRMRNLNRNKAEENLTLTKIPEDCFCLGFQKVSHQQQRTITIHD